MSYIKKKIFYLNAKNILLWIHLYIIMIGNRISIYLNSILTTGTYILGQTINFIPKNLNKF